MSATGFSPLTGVAFAPDGRYVAAVGADSVVRVWDMDTGMEILALKDHDKPVYGVAFSPDGKHLASGSEDETVKVH